MANRSKVTIYLLTILTSLLVANTAFAKRIDVFLLMGQSNMEGRSYDGSAPKYIESDNILTQNYDGSWKVAQSPLHYRGVGPGLAFAKNYSDHFPDRHIGLVPMAVGGTAIDRWVKGGDLYKRTLKQVAKIENGNIVGILWHQGESDTESDTQSANYQKRLEGLIKDIRKDLKQPELPFIVGELGHWLYEYPDRADRAKTINHVLKDTPNRLNNTGFASSQGLVNGDKWHFTVTDIRTLGERYFEQYILLKESEAK